MSSADVNCIVNYQFLPYHVIIFFPPPASYITSESYMHVTNYLRVFYITDSYYPIPGVCKLFTCKWFPPQPITLVSSKFTSRCRIDLATRICFLFFSWGGTHDVGASPMEVCRKFREIVKNVTEVASKWQQKWSSVSAFRLRRRYTLSLFQHGNALFFNFCSKYCISMLHILLCYFMVTLL
jgi:hypothetical protein